MQVYIKNLELSFQNSLQPLSLLVSFWKARVREGETRECRAHSVPALESGDPAYEVPLTLTAFLQMLFM